MGEIVAVQCPFSGCSGKPLLLLAAAPAGEAGNQMDIRLIRAKTTTQTCISEQHSVVRTENLIRVDDVMESPKLAE
jgi:hypothetical protein